MSEFMLSELLARAVLAEREREANAIARRARAGADPRGLRASFARRLVSAALCIHRDAASLRLAHEAAKAGQRPA